MQHICDMSTSVFVGSLRQSGGSCVRFPPRVDEFCTVQVASSFACAVHVFATPLMGSQRGISS